MRPAWRVGTSSRAARYTNSVAQLSYCRPIVQAAPRPRANHTAGLNNPRRAVQTSIAWIRTPRSTTNLHSSSANRHYTAMPGQQYDDDPTAEQAIELFKALEAKFPSATLGNDRWYLVAVRQSIHLTNPSIPSPYPAFQPTDHTQPPSSPPSPAPDSPPSPQTSTNTSSNNQATRPPPAGKT